MKILNPEIGNAASYRQAPNEPVDPNRFKEPQMKRYQPKSIRPAFGIASAAALTALTISLSVVVPVGLAPVAGAAMLAAPSSAPAFRQVTISPARIDVVVVRSTNIASGKSATRG
jgi:hypothetical protein